MVQVIAGDNKGQQGKVLKVEAEKQRAIVEGVNLLQEGHQTQRAEPPGRYRRERSAHPHTRTCRCSTPKSGKPTRVGRRLDAKGKLVRYAKKSGEEIK